MPLLPDYLQLAYRPDLHVFTVRWLRDVSLLELQTGFALALQEAQHTGTAHWLLDVRRRFELDAASSAWVTEQFLPRAAAQLPTQPLYTAFLVAPTRASAAQPQAPLHEVATRAQATNLPYQLQIFLDEGQAMQWLLETKTNSQPNNAGC